jgi:ABC-type antimicrobial peptide transport system permease subunit
MALGATPGLVAVPVLREALLLSLVGVAVGLPATVAVSRLIRSQLYGVGPHDPLALAAAVVALVAIALLAAWLPARRAARIDPMAALKNE